MRTNCQKGSVSQDLRPHHKQIILVFETELKWGRRMKKRNRVQNSVADSPLGHLTNEESMAIFNHFELRQMYFSKKIISSLKLTVSVVAVLWYCWG